MTALLLILSASAAAAQQPGTLIGNGALTAVADEFGRVSVCRWPGPAMNGQLGEGGLKWGIVRQGEIAWFGPDVCRAKLSEPWKPAVSAANLDFGDGSSAIQHTFTALDHDVLVSRVTLHGFDAPPELVWQADFSPCPRLAPEIAGVGGLPGRDFAAFVEDGRVFSFRPLQPGRKEFTAAANGEWETFKEAKGVWVVCASGQPVIASCLPGNGKKAFGDCRSQLRRLPPNSGGGSAATVYAAFGPTRSEAEEALDAAMAAGADVLLARISYHWGKFTETAVPGDGGTSDRLADLATVGLAMDKQTGAFTRNPAGNPGEALCYTRDCAWASLALDLAAQQDTASDLLKFIAALVRTEQRRGKPLGSLPLAVYGDGTEALPHLALDADAPAYALGGMWRHSTAIEDAARRKEFIKAVWDSAVLMANFLAGWTDSRNREPLYSFDTAIWRNRQGDDRLLTTYMGIDAALRLANAAGVPEPPEWARRKVELDALIRFQLVDRESKTWRSPDILPYWYDLMAQEWARRGPPLPSWEPVVEQWIADPPQNPAQAAAANALVLPDDPARIAAALEKARAGADKFNALQAAQRFIAATLLTRR